MKAMMTTDTARASSIGTLIERDPLLRTMPNVVLAVHLLIERNSPASLWEPYINTLPHSYSTVLYFNKEQLEGLRGSPALEDALKQCKFVARQYAYFYRLFANTLLKDYLTFDEYRWAVSTVMTRQNVVPGVGEEAAPVTSLIPFWDLANHDHGQLSTDYDPEADATVCLAQRDFSQGEQFTIFYGVRANCDLLIHNGFVFPDNQADILEEMDKEDTEILGLCRVEKETPVDAKVMQYMITRAALLLRSYPTTLEQDQATMKGSKDPVLRLTTQLLLCEKRILVATVAYCEQKLQALQPSKE